MFSKKPYWRKYCQPELKDWNNLRYKKVLGLTHPPTFLRQESGRENCSVSKNHVSSNALFQSSQRGWWKRKALPECRAMEINESESHLQEQNQGLIEKHFPPSESWVLTFFSMGFQNSYETVTHVHPILPFFKKNELLLLIFYPCCTFVCCVCSGWLSCHFIKQSLDQGLQVDLT